MTATATATPTTAVATVSVRSRWAGRILSAVLAAFFIFDATTHIALIDPVRDAFAELGLGTQYGPVIGIVLLACLTLYMVPRTALLGGILMTGYLGGAVAVNMVADEAVLSTVLFPVYVGVVVWTALWLRDIRVRKIFPLLFT